MYLLSFYYLTNSRSWASHTPPHILSKGTNMKPSPRKQQRPCPRKRSAKSVCQKSKERAFLTSLNQLTPVNSPVDLRLRIQWPLPCRCTRLPTLLYTDLGRYLRCQRRERNPPAIFQVIFRCASLFDHVASDTLDASATLGIACVRRQSPHTWGTS